MSDRPSPSNGKRDMLWGTLEPCSECGRCLCYRCHPHGPCVDEREAAVAGPAMSTNPESAFTVAVNAAARRERQLRPAV